MKYEVLRPPLIDTYELPSRGDLLKLKTGDLAKVVFQVGNDNPERMWVILEDCSKPDEWTGLLDNDATQSQTAKALPAGTLVKFHPLDIISVE